MRGSWDLVSVYRHESWLVFMYIEQSACVRVYVRDRAESFMTWALMVRLGYFQSRNKNWSRTMNSKLGEAMEKQLVTLNSVGNLWTAMSAIGKWLCCLKVTFASIEPSISSTEMLVSLCAAYFPGSAMADTRLERQIVLLESHFHNFVLISLLIPKLHWKL